MACVARNCRWCVGLRFVRANTGSGGTSMDAMAVQLDAQKTLAATRASAGRCRGARRQKRSKRRPPRSNRRPSRSDESRAAKAWHRADITRRIVGARRHVLNKVDEPGLDASRAAFSGDQWPAAQGPRRVHEQDCSSRWESTWASRKRTRSFSTIRSEGQWGTLYVVEKETPEAVAAAAVIRTFGLAGRIVTGGIERVDAVCGEDSAWPPTLQIATTWR